MLVRRHDSGDTIVEVLFSFAVLAAVVLGGIALMNQGVGMAQRSLEITLVREQMDSQAAALRFLNKQYISMGAVPGAATDDWESIVSNADGISSAQDFDQVANNNQCNIPTHSGNRPFTIDVLNISDKNFIVRPTSDVGTYARVIDSSSGTTAEGIWIQAVKSSSKVVAGKTTPGYYDFHIRACWFSPGKTRPITLGTIVRLYDPKA